VRRIGKDRWSGLVYALFYISQFLEGEEDDSDYDFVLILIKRKEDSHIGKGSTSNTPHFLSGRNKRFKRHHWIC